MMRVLCVCLGNICRSPTAEGVLRALAASEAPELGLIVDSAGTASYHVGDPPDPRSVQAALGRGIDLSSLRARAVELRDFHEFDFVLAMDRDNLRVLEARRPANSRAALHRLLEFAPELGRLDVPDPYYGGSADFETVLDLVTAGARGFLATLRERAETQGMPAARGG